MSDPANTAPAGWYPDPNGAPTMRWWDGANWTQNYAPAGGLAAVRPQLPADARIDGPWIWLVAALPLVSIVSLFVIDFRGYLRATMEGDTSGILTSLGIGYVIALLLGWGAWGAGALFSYYDWRDLRRVGVVRPFHWAWAFLAGLVYLIGRTVIVRKVSTRGLAPLWGGIAVYVLVFVVTIVWTIWITMQAMQSVYDYLPDTSYYSYS